MVNKWSPWNKSPYEREDSRPPKSRGIELKTQIIV